jgi:hypothetical protein
VPKKTNFKLKSQANVSRAFGSTTVHPIAIVLVKPQHIVDNSIAQNSGLIGDWAFALQFANYHVFSLTFIGYWVFWRSRLR